MASKQESKTADQEQYSPVLDQHNEFEKAFSDQGFWSKLKKTARAAGREVVEKTLLLYYTMQKEDIPAWARATIIGALGYFIVPLDAIADITPTVGYADDLGVLVLALAAVAQHIDAEVRGKADVKLKAWFGDAP